MMPCTGVINFILFMHFFLESVTTQLRSQNWQNHKAEELHEPQVILADVLLCFLFELELLPEYLCLCPQDVDGYLLFRQWSLCL
jgi:protein-S-isoprenylcysteine O-methyltransferase Ste14